MNKIIFPLKLRMKSPAVGDLQGALQLLLDRGVILANDEGARRELTAILLRERAEQTYGSGTRKLVNAFQEERQLQTGGAVDEPTAEALNVLLRELGMLDQIKTTPGSNVVSGAVRREDGLALRDVRVRAVHEADRGEIRLGEDTTDAEGRYTIRYEQLPEIASIHLRVSAIGEDGTPLQSAEVVGNAKSLEVINLTVPLTGKPSAERRIEGRIVLEHGLPAAQMKLRLYRRDFGGKATLLNETSTLAGGQYAFTYDPGGKAASLEVRAVKGANEEILLSKPLSDLSGESRAALNLVAPGALQPLAAEYRRLAADLTPQVGLMTKLADAKETDERQDLTVLNHATGWDARLIALAATTERLSADADVQLPQEFVYGLLRAGLPSDKLMLAQVEPEVAEQALKTVRDAGIVELSDQQIGDFKKEFTTFATKVRLNIPAPGSRSTYGALLKASGVSADAQTKFAPVYLRHRGDASQLWDDARKAGLDDAQVRKLQLQGKLAFLAGNSEGMTTRLMQKQINDPVQLVEQDFHRADSWVTEVLGQAEIPLDRRNNLTVADKEKLVAVIPAAYAGGKVEDRLVSYAENMARMVRLSYPTRVVGRMIEQDEIKLPADRDATVTLMKNAAGQGFRLGETPVETFFKNRMTKDEFQAARPQLQQLKTLQRVYQITPSNEAMPVLISLGMTSAYDVMAYSEADFTALYAGKYFDLYGKVPTQAESRLVYRKAKQVSSVTYNLFTIAKKLDSEPPVAGMSAPVEVRESVRKELIKQFPTLESLFGSMDFCECEHCRSVLSPAAYLVDLLQFVDPESGDDNSGESKVWTNFLARWKETHGQQDYPHKDDDGTPMTPYDVLIKRRPDLPHIALTCENTHTALPYIDVVNEILEYYVANGKLEEDAAHDTGEATTAELLAEPQNVIRGAYDKLREARYPLTLPFDLWIETVRRFCNYFETPLARVLEVFRPNDDLFAPAQPFDRSTIFMESLGLSSAELASFTDADPLGNDKWHELYGFPTVRPAIQNPTNAANATLTVANADAKKFREGLACTYFDVSANARSAEPKTISTIGDSDSGGAGQIIITFAGVWAARPDAGDLLVCNASATLSSAKTLSRRLGVTYTEIAEIVQTGFVNPKLAKLGVLYKLGVSIHDARFYLDHKGLLPQDPTTLSTEDQKRRLEVEAFSQELGTLAVTLKVSTAQLEAELQAIPFNGVLVLADRDAGCNFDLTTLRYANGDQADAIAYLKINLFVRLWRKLGWSIEETDRALQALVPKNTPFETAYLNTQPLKTALIYLAHLKALDEKVRVGRQSRLKLVTLWTDIATTGKKPLYAQLFLTRSVLKSDAVFDDALGQYLSPLGVAAMADSRTHEVRREKVAPADKIDPAAFAGEPKIRLSYDELTEVQYLSYQGVLNDVDKAALSALSPSSALGPLLDAVEAKAQEFTLIRAHLLALQGALALTADEIGHILEDAGKSLGAAELSLPHVSLLYRYGLLAKALKMSVRDLIALKQLSGLNPFTQLHPLPLVDTPVGVVPPKKAVESDYPFSQTLRFVEVAEEIKESGLKIEDLEYLLRHRFDETGKYRPNSDATLALLKVMSEGIRAIRAEHAVPNDPGAMSEEVLRQKLGLALPSDVVERFLAMMNGTAEFTATKTGLDRANELKPATFSDEGRIRQLSYKEVPHKEQKLTLRGVLFDAQKTELQTNFDAVLTAPQRLAFAELLGGVKALAREFFDNQLKKQKLRLDDEAGFLEDGDFSSLFLPLKPLKKILSTDTQQEIDDKLIENEKTQRENLTELQLRRSRIAQAFLPFLQQHMIRQFIVQTMTAHTGADPVLVESLLTDERLLAGPKSLLDAFAAAGERGIEATYFFSEDQSGLSLTTQLQVDDPSNPAGTVSDPIRSTGANRTGLDGYLEVPQDDAYEFSVVLAKKDDKTELRIGDQLNPLIQKVATHDGEEFSTAQVNLEKGKRYRIQLAVAGRGARQVSLMAKSAILPKAAYNSSRLEGYLEAPTPGAYRFYVALDKQNAEASLRFDHLPDPVFLSGAAVADNAVLGDQPSEFLELKPGIPYRFSLDLKKLNGGEARLLVQGETMPKESVSQLKLYPLSAIAGAERATLLLAKVLQLVQSLGLNEREIRYLLTHAADFGGLNLSQLPTQPSDDTPAEKVATTERFARFLRMASYVRLKRDLVGGSDDLISVFENARHLHPAGTDVELSKSALFTDVCKRIADQARRDAAIVQATAQRLGYVVTATPVAAGLLVAAPDFAQERGIQRLWEALQVVERFGVPVASLLEWTRVVSLAAPPEQRFEIARDLKEAIKARFEPETWQRMAQPIFDKLRQRQRDALVSHVLHQHCFDRMEQLYEYFLIDPGMEPVVQTSRIRLAIASVQLFIQRCLLNMELQVHPSVINSKQWEWMKRYRVWEANRKIFLFPENWLEPEFRDDKTHLFAELEGALLQGDVSSDLVEDAFLDYLKKLDELARLDIVAMHLEDNPDPARRILHVIGRTYSQPHKYFYRRYAHQMWTPWEPVSAEIEGDHLAPVVWRDRLYLFWVTFMDKPVGNPQHGSKTKNKTLAEASLSEVIGDVSVGGQKKQIDVQLHWSKYLAGEWSTRESSGFILATAMTSVPPHWERRRVGDTRPSTIEGYVWVEATESPAALTVPLTFDYTSVFIHVSKEPYENGEERGVYIHLRGGGVNQAFYLAGRNSTPESAICAQKPANPFSTANRARANRYAGSGALTLEFKRHITTEGGKQPVDTVETSSILQQCGAYTLLPCDNSITLVATDSASLDEDNPVAIKAAIESGLPEIASLMKPVFYQDNAYTLFVEPNVTERTIEEWQEWITHTPQPEPGWVKPDWWKDIIVIPEVPRKGPIPDPRDPRLGFEIDRGALVNPRPDRDWLVNPGTALEFDGALIGPAGRPGLEILPARGTAEAGTPVNVNPGSGLASGSTVVLTGTTTLEQNGLTQVAGGLNIVGGGGFNAALEKNFKESNRSGFGAGMSGSGRLGR